MSAVRIFPRLISSFDLLINRKSRLIPIQDTSHLITRAMTTAMGKRLEGKTIIITGASSGIGRSTGMSNP